MGGKIGIIIQARMGATRLPNKIMLLLSGKPVLWHVVERCKKADVQEVIVATSINKENDVIESFCKKNNYPCFRGSEDDVLDRYYQCAKSHHLNVVIRIPGDCPLISFEVIDEIIKKFAEGKTDYVSNVAVRSFPRGLDCEIFSFDALEKAHSIAKKKPHREHVTAFIYGNPKMFRINNVIAKGLLKRPDLRLCIDTKEDLFLLSKIYDNFYRGRIIHIEEVIRFLDKNPDLARINMQAELDQLKKNQEQGIKQNFIKK